ncbi:dihydroxyacetone phosphate acyltransferase [Diabrotica virgifera virgifera]|uniref:Phospholipid/glycerol acyltransferase domain-containing protein n=1 Tax=Diabrotica virgifera virgifera TaxID=50390 RepID=A0ABM5KI21_DIAVI|nr:dihydroxyacetone phosphate acyltransferase [Diabrotica virgifera virgifera]
MSVQRKYENFLEYRRKEKLNFLWISKRWDPVIAFKQGGSRRPTPHSHKVAVLRSPKIQELLDQISRIDNIPKATLETQVRDILDEIGYDRNLKIVRWLGLVLTKICLKVLSGIYVNIDQVEKIKSRMGNCPVIFVPTHRSYGDFMMLSYANFNYDIEIPAITAGMDFHGMWGVGKVLRDTGAFFMRRTYTNDNLYWTTFREYVYQLVTKGDLPMEFFIEGTRSRSNKSLPPKYGVLSMALKAFFFSQVPDILFVPIGISYDRILEESLFAFELLGVPKPKESTSGLFKSMKILKENFGNIYLHMDEPISVKEYFGDKINRSIHSIGPLHKQEVTVEEKRQLPPLAHEILKRQQNATVLTVFNLMAIIINNNLTYQTNRLTVKELVGEVTWIRSVVDKLGAFTHFENAEKGVREALITHNNLIRLDKRKMLRLIKNRVSQQVVNPKKLKGHALSDTTMTESVPFVMLQIYTNPVLQFLIDINIILVILKYKTMDKDELFDNYQFLRSIFAKEFVIFSAADRRVFDSAINQALSLELIQISDECCQLGVDKKLQELVINAFTTFYVSYDVVFLVLEKLSAETDEKSILVNAQKWLENAISEKLNVHPYSLNLDTLVNCISILCELQVLKKDRRDNKNIYEINKGKLSVLKNNFEKFIPQNILNRSYTVVRDHLQNKL